MFTIDNLRFGQPLNNVDRVEPLQTTISDFTSIKINFLGWA